MTDKTDKRDIKKASNFDELYKILTRKKVIIGSSGKEYQARNIIDQIAQIREDLEDSQREWGRRELTPEKIGVFMLENESLKKQIVNITKKDGLRVKVIELAINEII